jgi:hypothetical protein
LALHVTFSGIADVSETFGARILDEEERET